MGGIPMKRPESSFAQQMAVYAVVLSSLLGIPGACIALGWYLMKRYGWPEWTLIFPAFLGMAGAFYQIYRYMQSRWSNGE